MSKKINVKEFSRFARVMLFCIAAVNPVICCIVLSVGTEKFKNEWQQIKTPILVGTIIGFTFLAIRFLVLIIYYHVR